MLFTQDNRLALLSDDDGGSSLLLAAIKNTLNLLHTVGDYRADKVPFSASVPKKGLAFQKRPSDSRFLRLPS